jgi:gluconate:H+ symporter, GntP family
LLYIILLLLAVVFIIVMTTKYNVHPFLALLFAAIGFGIFSGMPLNVIMDSINEGFGSTLGKIGLVIVIGVIIGEFLEKSGGAFSMAEKILKVIGKNRVPTAMGLIGWIVAIPVFADSGFIILSPLNKSLSKRAGISLSGPAIALGLGLLTTHCMVPPTPGPIGAAGILDADLGLVILYGLPISFICMIAGVFYSTTYAAKTYIDPAPEVSEEEISRIMKEAPGAFRSFVPILLPIFLIVIKSIVDVDKESTEQSSVLQLFSFIGQPVIALLIGMLLAFMLPKKFDTKMLSTTGWVGSSLTSACIILLITGAGGVFGKILQNSGIANVLGDALAGIHIGLLLPFLLTAAIKTAQGSSTVAMITVASIIAPLMISLGFESETSKALVVVAIGAGGMVVSHANDSLFWIVTQVTGLNVKTGFRLYTLGTLILGLTAAVMLLIADFIF